MAARKKCRCVLKANGKCGKRKRTRRGRKSKR
jgi:hypothetical protein